jgi:SulP family sulfate permease
MAFGVALFTIAGASAAYGALAGMLSATVINIVSGVGGGTRGLVCSPTGPMLVLLTASCISLMNAGLEGESLLLGLSAVMIFTGIFLFIIGITGGGKLVKFLPYPVISGFITGSGILMIMSQYKPLSTPASIETWSEWYWIPLLTAAITIAAISLVPKYFSQVPGTIAGLIIGTISFQLLSLFGPGPVPGEWVIGALPSLDNIKFYADPTLFKDLPWGIIMASAMALSLLASIDTLLTAVIADVETKSRHDARRELAGQGIGQLVIGLFGGMASSGTTGPTLVSIKSGGFRWAAVVAGVSLGLLTAVGGKIGTILPVSVLAGVIIHVAIGMLDVDIISWFKKRNARMDAGIAILVTIVTVTYDLIVAVGVGVLIAIVIFIRNEVKAPVVHRRSNISEMHSTKVRSEEERKFLDENAERIVLYELRGNLFFAKADQLFEELSEELKRNVYLILHLRRVRQIDLTAIKILQQIAEQVHGSGGQLMFCEVHSGMGIGRKMHKALRKVSPRASRWKVRTFLGSDEALAWAEDDLLKDIGPGIDYENTVIPLHELDIFTGMKPDEIDTLKQYMEPFTAGKDEVIFSRGDHGDELYIVLQGRVDIRLPTTKSHYKRLSVHGPGTLFGEVAFFDPGARSADAVAVVKTQLMMINGNGLKDLDEKHPIIALRLLQSLGRIQSRNIRWSAREMSRLSEW